MDTKIEFVQLQYQNKEKFQKRDFEWLKENYIELASWIKNSFQHMDDKFFEILSFKNNVYVDFYSVNNEYSLIAIIDNNGGFLALDHTCRKDGSGNAWTQGNYSENTWNKIMKDVFFLEVIPLVLVKKC
jgi:hypothetical protein